MVRDYDDDAALVHAHRAGDDQAFDALFHRYYHPLVSWIEWRCHDHARAEDIAQETFAAVARYIGTFDSSRPIWPWLRTIAGHLAGRATRAVAAEMPVERLPEFGECSDVIGTLDDRALMESALSKLPQRHQIALRLRYAEERSGPECAATLNMSPNAFNQLIWRARRLLKSELEALGSGGAGVGALVPIWLRRLWHRTNVARVRAEITVNMSTGVAAITLAASGALTIPGFLHESAPAAHVSAIRHVTSATEQDVAPAAHRPLNPRPAARVVKSSSVHAPIGRQGANVTVTTHAGGSSSQVKVAQNPLQSGTEEENHTTIDTPLGPIDLGGDVTGGENRNICTVVNCR
jgi:RNA polymerase sigma-70 factor (ECF subfamily)